MNNKVLKTTDGEDAIQEDLSPYFSIPFDLAGDRHYGIGLPELNIGDLRSLNELELRLLKIVNLASMARPVIDPSSGINLKEYVEAADGEPISAEVVGGKAIHLAWHGYGDVADFSMVTNSIDRKTAQIDRSFMNNAGALPKGDRVTKEAILRVGGELDSAFGGLFTFIAEGMQIPLVHRTLHQLRKDNLIKQLTDEHYRVVTQTGLAAISDQNKFRATFEFIQLISQLGEGVMDRINIDVLINAAARQARITEPGLLKTPEQAQSDRQERINQEQEIKQQDVATDVIGNIAQAQAENEIQTQSQQVGA